MDAAIEKAMQLPENGSVADDVCTVEFEEELPSASSSPQNFDDCNDNPCQQEIGPETGGASGEDNPPDVLDEYVPLPIREGVTEAERNAHVLQSIAPGVSPPTPQEDDPDPIPWPEAGAFVNDFNTVGLISKAFPCLFPYGNSGDPTFSDRVEQISLDLAGKHFLQYCINMKDSQERLKEENLTDDEKSIVDDLYHEGTSPWIYPFVKNDRFIHWMQNATECHRAYGQRSFWITKNAEYSTMTTDEVENIIRGGGDDLKQLLASMQSFNANINGSPQYLYKKTETSRGIN